MVFKAVLFDLDGTLLDTIEDITDSMNDVLSEMGLCPHEPDEYKKYVGEGVISLVKQSLPENCRDEETVMGCVAKLLDIYWKNSFNKTRPYEGITDLLDSLCKCGVRMAVLSNRPEISTKKMIEVFFKTWPFEHVIGSGPEFPNKPDPSAALEISKRLGIAPAEFIYVGDSDVDMQTANAAGMYPVGVLWGFRPRKELEENGAKRLIKKPAQLLDLI